MPQMMPLNWLMLFTLFSISLIFLNVLNYYMNINKMSYSTNNKKVLKLLIENDN